MTQMNYYSTPYGVEILNKKIQKLKQNHKDALEDLKNSQSNNTDLSENNEYLEAKERLDKIDEEKNRIEDRLYRTRVIKPNENPSREKVTFGLTITLYDIDQDKEFSYQIVGEEESDIKSGKISYLSPLAKAILGKSVGDEATFDLPGGDDRCVEIVEIK